MKQASDASRTLCFELDRKRGSKVKNLSHSHDRNTHMFSLEHLGGCRKIVVMANPACPKYHSVISDSIALLGLAVQVVVNPAAADIMQSSVMMTKKQVT